MAGMLGGSPGFKLSRNGPFCLTRSMGIRPFRLLVLGESVYLI